MAKHGPATIEEAYNKVRTCDRSGSGSLKLAGLTRALSQYKGSAFKFAQTKGWHVVVSGRLLVEEFFRAPEDVFSVIEASKKVQSHHYMCFFVFSSVWKDLQVTYTLGDRFNANSYHAPIVGSQFTRSLDKAYPDLHDEMVLAFNDQVVLDGDGMNISTFPVPTLTCMIWIRLDCGSRHEPHNKNCEQDSQPDVRRSSCV